VNLATSVPLHGPGQTPELITDWARLIRAEYCEMAGLSLTQKQVERLWRLDPSMASGVLNHLVDEGFLRCTSNGVYVRADLGGC
jgi:hypothetical protein